MLAGGLERGGYMIALSVFGELAVVDRYAVCRPRLHHMPAMWFTLRAHVPSPLPFMQMAEMAYHAPPPLP